MRKTRSVCPICLKPIAAVQVSRNGAVYLEKTCAEHGFFSVPIWRGMLDINAWRAGVEPIDGDDCRCPENCGICKEHQSGTCCALLEVTNRCNLHCNFCFANGGENEEQPDLDELELAVACIMEMGGLPTLQFSGGEPTLRDDLPLLTAYAKALGCPYVQLNTNGIRLAEDESYVRALSEAGLSYVFMQFDGVTDEVHQALRGAPLLEKKLAAIENCNKYGLGVTLVPTVVRGINDEQLGDIVRLGASLSPAVRGVHFQPVSYFGRYPSLTSLERAKDSPKNNRDDNRYTMDELIFGLCRQLNLDDDNFVPSHCDHPLCGFHGNFAVMPDGNLLPLSSRANCGTQKTSAEQNREYVARHWIRQLEKEKKETGIPDNSANSASDDFGAYDNGDGIDLDALLKRVRGNGFTLTAMVFQDAMNLDVERLRHCSLHVWQDYKLMPFCARYLTPIKE